MNERDFEKFSKVELIKMVEKLQKKARKPKIVIVDDDYRQVSPPGTYRAIPALRTNQTTKKPVPKSCKSVKKWLTRMKTQHYHHLHSLGIETNQPLLQGPISQQLR